MLCEIPYMKPIKLHGTLLVLLRELHNSYARCQCKEIMAANEEYMATD